MPIYEYRCEQGHTFEVIQRMTDEPIQTCGTCEQPVQRVFHPVAVHFKGSGFYNTDYGKQRRGRGGDDEAGGAKTEAGEGESSSSSDSKGSDSKGSDSKGSSQAAGSSGSSSKAASTGSASGS